MVHTMQQEKGDTKPSDYMRSLRRALSILKSFTPQEVRLSGIDISRRVGLHKTTVYRMLDVLASEGMIERDKKTSKYMIGHTMYTLGSLYLNTTDIATAADPVIKILHDLTNEGVYLGILDNGNLILTMKEEYKCDFILAKTIGSILPAHTSSLGKVLLSEFAEGQIDKLFPGERLLKITPKSIVDKKKFKLELEQIRKTGVAIDDEGTFEGVTGVASIIRDCSGKALASISIGSMPRPKLSQTYRDLIAQLVKMAASLISYRLGYQNESNPIRSTEEIRSWWEQNKANQEKEEKE